MRANKDCGLGKKRVENKELFINKTWAGCLNWIGGEAVSKCEFFVQAQEPIPYIQSKGL